MSYAPQDITSGYIEFRAEQDRKGVNILPDEMEAWAEDFAERRDRTITEVEGNFEWTRFHFEPEYDDVDEWETMMVEEGM